MKAADVMVSNVITVGPDATVKEVADLLLRNRISAVPVLGPKGELLGIVSEGDLMRRPEAGIEVRHPWWLDMFASQKSLASEFIKTHSLHVLDVMTRNVITAKPDTSLSDIAGLLQRNNIKRVPIVQDGKIVGIVSRANLVQAMATQTKMPASMPDDASIRSRLVTQLMAERWAWPSLMNLIVHDGTVDLWGMVDSKVEKKAVRVLVESTPGVRNVNDNLIIRPISASNDY